MAIKEEKKPAQVFHFDLFGKREDKYDFLNENSISSIAWNTLQPQEPELFFVPKDFAVQEIYNKGFKINEIFPINSVGIVTARDGFTIHNTEEQVKKVIEDFLILDDETARIKYELGKDVRDWQVNFAKKDLLENYPNKGKITKISYRPFDIRYTFYTGNSKGFHCYPRNEVSKHFINNDNFGIVFEKIMMNKKTEFNDIFITNKIFDSHAIGSASYSFPLYLYPETTGQQNAFEQEAVRVPNLNMEIVNEISKKLGIPFVAEKTNNHQPTTINQFAPIDILDYIYAVLHSPSYREKYKEFLKIDFPRVPFPKNLKTFFELVNLGSQLRQIHLLESDVTENYITKYPIDGDNVIEKPKFEIIPNRVLNFDTIVGKVYINETQYFENVPEVAWNFYIGGYQPAQKWLKDRKDRTLSHEDIFHYQKIIVALTETDRLMKEIDKIEI